MMKTSGVARASAKRWVRHGVGAGILALLCAAAVACASGSEGAASGEGALTPKSSNTSDPSASAKAPRGVSPSLGGALSGGTFTPVDVVVLEDTMLNDDGSSAPRERVIASNKAGLCERLTGDWAAWELLEGETAVSVWSDVLVVGAYKSRAEELGFTSGGALLDTRAMCVTDEIRPPDRGTGSFQITSTSGPVTGAMDLTFVGGHVSGTFEAKRCRGQTNSRVTCPRR